MKTIIPIFPTDEQKTLFQHWQNNTRWLWNECVGKMNAHYEQHHDVLRKKDFNTLAFTLLQEVSWLQDTPYKALEFTIEELDNEIQKSITQHTSLPTFKRKKKERDLINIQLQDIVTVNNEVISFANLTDIKCVKSKFIKKECPIRITSINGDWTIELGKSLS